MESSSFMNPLQVFVKSTDEKSQIQKISITSNSSGKVYFGKNPIEINIEDYNRESIYLALKRHRLIIEDDLIGHATLPLIWFPMNCVVREWFPINMKSTPEIVHYALLDVHVNSNNEEPFNAPYTMLRAPVTWPRPFLHDHAEIPLIPPVVYISPEFGPINEDFSYPESTGFSSVSQLDYTPKHQIFYDQNMNSIGYFNNTPSLMQLPNDAPSMQHYDDQCIPEVVAQATLQTNLQSMPNFNSQMPQVNYPVVDPVPIQNMTEKQAN